MSHLSYIANQTRNEFNSSKKLFYVLKIKLPAAPVTRTLSGSVATIMIWNEILERKK